MLSNIIKRRKAKLSERGLYLQDKELRDTDFKVGQHFKYVVDIKKKQIRIIPTNETTKNTVSKRKLRDGLKPVLDLRDREALQAFQGADHLEVVIFENEVLVRGLRDEKLRKTSLFSISDYLKRKEVFNARLDRDELASVVGDFSFSSSSETFEHFSSQQIEEIPLVLRAISLFSGSGTMDWAMKEAGFDIVCAVEKDEEAAQSYRYNIGEHIHVADITEFDKTVFHEYDAPIILGGSPCQGFSNANRRMRFLDNPNNLLVREYIDSVKANPNSKIFVLENVPQLLTAGGGQFLEEIKEELSDFTISYGVLNSKDFGDPQSRERAILIGSKIGPISLPKPVKEETKTVYDAFQGLHDGIPNQLDVSLSRADTIERMEHIPQGGNWTYLPDELKTKGMFKGNTQSNVYRRLKWDEVSPTIVNVRKSLLTHPTENRILSVRECARLFSLPDDFIFLGSLESRQQQICNAVCAGLMKAVGTQIKNAITNFNALIKRRMFGLV